MGFNEITRQKILIHLLFNQEKLVALINGNRFSICQLIKLIRQIEKQKSHFEIVEQPKRVGNWESCRMKKVKTPAQISRCQHVLAVPTKFKLLYMFDPNEYASSSQCVRLAVSIQNNIIDFISLPLGGKQGLKGLALKIEGSELDNFCHYNSLLSTPLAHWCHTLSNSLKIRGLKWNILVKVGPTQTFRY